ncbi:MAG TPA: hypothetical protein DEP46_05365, partial [Blastocatellia bacterium]|nr:hypothetical protein [Blastocatellia bacterium]
MTNIFRVMLFLFAATAVYAQPQVSSQGDDWRLVAYKFARVNNYNIDDKEVSMTLDTREGRIAGNSGCNRFMGP